MSQEREFTSGDGVLQVLLQNSGLCKKALILVFTIMKCLCVFQLLLFSFKKTLDDSATKRLD